MKVHNISVKAMRHKWQHINGSQQEDKLSVYSRVGFVLKVFIVGADHLSSPDANADFK